MTQQFRQLKEPISDNVLTDAIQYTDADGTVWFVPQGHRFWASYEQWLSDGNTPLPAA